MKRNLIAVVFFSLASAQAGVAWAGATANGMPLNGLSVNGVLENGLYINGIDLQAKRPNDPSLDRMPPSANGSENVAARPRSECMVEPERCAIDTPRAHAPGASVQSVTLPDGSTYMVR